MPNWIQQTGGGGYDLDARKWIGRFDYEQDVVHSLAGIYRMKASTPVFKAGRGWSVAIHSVAMQRVADRLELPPDAQLAILEHDKHESVTGDIPTPIARRIGRAAIEELKREVQAELDLKQGIPWECQSQQHESIIRLLDTAALHEERHFFMSPSVIPWEYPEPQPMYSQLMVDVIKEILAEGEHKDGGFESYMAAYEYLRSKI